MIKVPPAHIWWRKCYCFFFETATAAAASTTIAAKETVFPVAGLLSFPAAGAGGADDELSGSGTPSV